MKSQVRMKIKKAYIYFSIVGLTSVLALGAGAFAEDDMMGAMPDQKQNQATPAQPDVQDSPDMDHDHDQMKKDHAKMIKDHKKMKDHNHMQMVKKAGPSNGMKPMGKNMKDAPMGNSGGMMDDKMDPPKSDSGSGGMDHM